MAVNSQMEPEAQSRGANRILVTATIAFTLCFAVWGVFTFDLHNSCFALVLNII